MKQVERIGVSLDKKLLSMFDRLIAGQGYQNRSEAIRDLIRQKLSAEHLSDPKAKAVAAVFLVYDHHSTNLTERIIGSQHSHIQGSRKAEALQTICSTHIHLDEQDCLEVIVLQGCVGEINKMADNMLSLKGVKLGRVNLIAGPPVCERL